MSRHPGLRNTIGPQRLDGIRMLRVVEVAFIRGKGDHEDDPIRQVFAYYDEDGTLLAETDPFLLEQRT